MSTNKKNTANIHIRLPADEKAAYTRAAEKQGFDLTTWIRVQLRSLLGLDR